MVAEHVEPGRPSTGEDPVFALHRGGKMEIAGTVPLRDAAARPGDAVMQVEGVARLLASFPGMMRRPRHPPPFIHRTQVREGKRGETLGISISLIGLWFVRAFGGLESAPSQFASSEYSGIIMARHGGAAREGTRLDAWLM